MYLLLVTRITVQGLKVSNYTSSTKFANEPKAGEINCTSYVTHLKPGHMSHQPSKCLVKIIFPFMYENDDHSIVRILEMSNTKEVNFLENELLCWTRLV